MKLGKVSMHDPIIDSFPGNEAFFFYLRRSKVRDDLVCFVFFFFYLFNNILFGE